jgi:hypothetical protein
VSELMALATKVGLDVFLVGAMVYFLRYLVTVTIPRMTRTFARALAEERRANREDIAKLSADLVNKVDELRALMERVQNVLFQEIRRANHISMAIRDRGCARGPFPEDDSSRHPLKPPGPPAPDPRT